MRENSSGQDSTIVIFGYYRYPCRQAVMENVFAKAIGKERNVIWLFRTDGRVPSREIPWHHSKIRLVWACPGNGLFAKMMNYLTFWLPVFAFFRLRKTKNVSTVFVRDMPITTILLSIIKRFYPFRLYYQYSAPMGDFDKARYHFTPSPKKHAYLLRGRALNFLVKKAIKRSDLVFPITRYFAKEIGRYYDQRKLIPLTMGVDQEWADSCPSAVGLLADVKSGTFILNYSGTLNFTRKPLFMLKVFRQVLETNPDALFVVMGKTGADWEQEQLNRFCKDAGIQKNVRFTGHVDRNELLAYLKQSDLSISAIPPTDYYRISSPTKVYESLGAGIPVVANRGISEQESVIEESGGGMLVDYDVDAFASAITELIRDPHELENMSKNGKRYVLDNYSYSTIAKKILPYFG